MNTFLDELIKQRTKLIEGLNANEGDINLDIFEDFYPDQAHFVFELLQNAEDAGATEVTLTLLKGGCRFEHNGTRYFTENDVRAITGIHSSTKSKSQDQIGKFGIGFKSVFVYTQTPEVYSGDFSFRISELILPNPVEQDPLLGTKTRFWFPFNNPDKSPQDAFAEIDAALKSLAETTLLFLSNIESISWNIEGKATGDIVRVQHSANHFEVLRQDETQTTSAHFLRFDRPAAGLGKQKVAVAFALDFIQVISTFDLNKSLAEQLRVVPAQPGQVAVFFPAEKETSGLRFHLHAPFVPELSRASIKETSVNEPLFKQLADLTAVSLHQIRDLGLLSVEFLAVLPNSQDQIPSRYLGIRESIVKAMNEESLTPTYTKSHAPAKHLLQARASLKELLSKDDLEFLIEYDEEPPEWAASATQKNSNADRFLTGLAIRGWDTNNFTRLLERDACERSRYDPSSFRTFRGADPNFANWLSNKPVEWIQHCYAFLYTELNSSAVLQNKIHLKLVRLGDGNFSVGSKCYFPKDEADANDGFPRVDANIYTSGRSKTRQEYAMKFLEELGVRSVGEAEEIEAILKQRYTPETIDPKKQDLVRFVTLVEKEPDKAVIFEDYFIFKLSDGKWGMPSHAFLDTPFLDTGLKAFHDAVGASHELLGVPADRYSVDESYYKSGKVTMKRFVRFAESVGVQTKLEVCRKTVRGHPSEAELKKDLYKYGVRISDYEIDEDWEMPSLSLAIKSPSIALARLIWNTLDKTTRQALSAGYRPNKSFNTRLQPSSLVLLLRQNAWVPQKDNKFVRPEGASASLLPSGFPFDETSEWLKALRFGESEKLRSQEYSEKQKVAKKFGFEDLESLEQARQFAALPVEERKEFFEQRARREAFNLPEDKPSNPERRAERVGEQAAAAPGRESETRTRSVSTNREAVKKEAEQYLRQRYTNVEEEMICQVCKAPLPFKLNNGSSYFEKVEFLTGLHKRHHQNYLALCPNHAAMFQHANGSEDLMLEMFKDMSGYELEVVLAQQNTTIYFTKTHAVDMKAVIAADKATNEYEPED